MTIVTQYPSSNSASSGGGLTSPTLAYASDSNDAQGSVTAVTTAKGSTYGNFGFDTALPPFIRRINQVLLEVRGSERRDAPPTDASHAKTTATPQVGGTPLTGHDEQDPADTTRQYDITSARSWTRSDFLDGTLACTLTVIYIDAPSTGFFDFVRFIVDFEEGTPPRHAAAIYYPPVRM